MRDFFSGWRRKVGCLLLCVACLLSLLWYRSLFFGDRMAIGLFGAVSQLGEFSVGFSTHPGNFAANSVPLHGVQTGTSPTGMGWTIRELRWSHMGLPIPYWPIVIPLAAIAAILILWPRRKRESRPKLGMASFGSPSVAPD